MCPSWSAWLIDTNRGSKRTFVASPDRAGESPWGVPPERLYVGQYGQEIPDIRGETEPENSRLFVRVDLGDGRSYRYFEHGREHSTSPAARRTVTFHFTTSANFDHWIPVVIQDHGRPPERVYIDPATEAVHVDEIDGTTPPPSAAAFIRLNSPSGPGYTYHPWD